MQQLFLDMWEALKSMGELLFKLMYEISESGGALRTAIEMICALIRFIVNEARTANLPNDGSGVRSVCVCNCLSIQ